MPTHDSRKPPRFGSVAFWLLAVSLCSGVDHAIGLQSDVNAKESYSDVTELDYAAEAESSWGGICGSRVLVAPAESRPHFAMRSFP
ncbi:MAG: hypothetical protein AAF517_21945 [Planctomycetota bacterium]